MSIVRSLLSFSVLNSSQSSMPSCFFTCLHHYSAFNPEWLLMKWQQVLSSVDKPSLLVDAQKKVKSFFRFQVV